MATKINPTFLIKGIDPYQAFAKYKAGAANRPVVRKGKLRVVQSAPMLAEKYGATNESAIFTVKDRNNNSVVIATSDHADYEVFTSSGGMLPAGGRCRTCQEQFTTVGIGYPVAFQEHRILTNVNGPAQYSNLYTFWVEDKFCSFECALHYVRFMLARPNNQRDPILQSSECWLIMLYRLMHPGAPTLRPAPDPKLLQGTLTREQWADRRHVYKQTERIVMIPAKREYMQQVINRPIVAIAPDYTRVNAPATIIALT